jgi:signal transduction histidine kinase
VPLGNLIEQSLALCEARFKKDAVKLITEPVPSEWSLECRDSQISQVLLNLLGNAHDAAMEAPERWVKLAAEDIGDSFEFSITDSGPGMTEEIADKILEPFFTTKPAGKGTGLGLSISHKIVVEHMGQLALDRASPHTRFTVRLPKRRSDVGAHDVRRAS